MLPATFLDHANCPRLESIALSRCTIPLGPPLDLTDLALHKLVADDILPIFQLLLQLQRLSALIVQFHRSVDLHGEMEKWDEIHLSLKPITMPHIAKFDLKGRNPECSMVIGNLIAPRLSELFMECTITTGCLEEFAEVNDTLEDFIGRSGVTAKDQAGVSASVSGADVNPGDDRTCKLEVFSWSTPEHACASSSKVSNGLSVEFSWPDESVPPLLRLAGDVCHAARLGDVHTLDLDLVENLFDADVLEETISLVQRLESLRFLSVDGLADNHEDDVLVLLSGKDYLRYYEDDTMEGYHHEVVCSAVPRAYEPSDTPTTPVPMSPSNDETNDPSSSPLL
ncbi:hypothetical protein EWM64_g7326 [Hericium alpestre]|uniref:Uncharacterized protein n=1 Tax=Hericium alpestre TaxID=135208 RepID=A0A4Y9ZT68_9AGAM|nr:hypothetical protein EWM64_g7326 [Hericium alpestre]